MKIARQIAFGFHLSLVGMYLMFVDKNGPLGLFGFAMIFGGLFINLLGYFRKD